MPNKQGEGVQNKRGRGLDFSKILINGGGVLINRGGLFLGHTKNMLKNDGVTTRGGVDEQKTIIHS